MLNWNIIHYGKMTYTHICNVWKPKNPQSMHSNIFKSFLVLINCGIEMHRLPTLYRNYRMYKMLSLLIGIHGTHRQISYWQCTISWNQSAFLSSSHAFLYTFLVVRCLPISVCFHTHTVCVSIFLFESKTDLEIQADVIITTKIGGE